MITLLLFIIINNNNYYYYFSVLSIPFPRTYDVLIVPLPFTCISPLSLTMYPRLLNNSPVSSVTWTTK